jgi:hypothetical protein
LKITENIWNNVTSQWKNWYQMKNIPEFIGLTFLGAFVLIISTGIHELAHSVTGSLLNCPNAIMGINLFNGSTAVGTCSESSMVLMALAGPGIAFLLGMLVWFTTHPDHPAKIWSYVAWFYGTLPNLAPWANGSDMHVAVQNGLNPLLGYAIFGFAMLIIFPLIFKEIEDKQEGPK